MSHDCSRPLAPLHSGNHAPSPMMMMMHILSTMHASHLCLLPCDPCVLSPDSCVPTHNDGSPLPLHVAGRPYMMLPPHPMCSCHCPLRAAATGLTTSHGRPLWPLSAARDMSQHHTSGMAPSLTATTMPPHHTMSPCHPTATPPQPPLTSVSTCPCRPHAPSTSSPPYSTYAPPKC